MFVWVGGDWLKRQPKKVWRRLAQKKPNLHLYVLHWTVFMARSVIVVAFSAGSTAVPYVPSSSLPWPEAATTPLAGTATLTSTDARAAASIPGRSPQ